MNALFIARMENILWLYSLPFDERFPVVCFDERPCFLIGETVQGIKMKAGQPARENYAYEKLGSCALLATIEPLTGNRVADVLPDERNASSQRICKSSPPHIRKPGRSEWFWII
ncbi:MAG TPA: hypothetical protein VK308_10135 [Pyrinomonadaceae bacterium]|nr:hypothetical protein [Pyrinomonadaceae bacterium]